MTEFHEQLTDAPKWGGTTDPTQHDPANFRYLVHAINPYSTMNALTITLYDAKDGVEYDESWGDQKISMYDQPERIAERVSLSMSLVDQDHTATWGEAGLIVEAPEHNMVLTSSSDAGAHNNNLDFLLKQADKHGVMSGDNLLRSSSPYSYNEVVAVASRDGQQLQLKGFFYKSTKASEPFNKQLASRMQAHASRLGLPVVAITEQGHYVQDKVENNEGRLAVQFNGSRYMLAGYEPQHQFKVYDERGHSHFAAPHELEPVLGFAVQAGGLTEDEAASVTTAYQEADMQRQTPTVEFDEDGSVKEISYRTGYGADEARVSLGKSGHGYRTNLAMQAEKMQEAMLSMGKPQMIGFDEDRSYTPLSPAEGDSMVEAACANLDEEKAGIVRDWYAKSREVLDKQWGYHLESRRSRFGFMSGRMLDIDYSGLKSEPLATFTTPTETTGTYHIKTDISPSGIASIIKKIQKNS